MARSLNLNVRVTGPLSDFVSTKAVRPSLSIRWMAASSGRT